MIKRPSLKIVLKKKKTTDNFGYLYIRIGISKNPVPVYVPIGKTILEKDWDEHKEAVKKSNPDYYNINLKAQNELNKLNARFVSDEANDIEHTRESVLQIIGSPKTASDFIELWQSHLDGQVVKDNEGKTEISESYARHKRNKIARLREYAGEKLPFSQITAKWLKDYETYLLTSKNGHGGVGIARTTLHTTFKRIKEVIDLAIQTGRMKPEQIAGYKWPTYKKPEVDYLTIEEIERIANLVYEWELDKMHTVIAAAFVIECYSGIRFSDWGKHEIEMLTKERAFKVKGTKKTNTPIYLYFKHFPKLGKMIDYVEEKGLQFNKFNYVERTVNKALKLIASKARISKDFTTHIGRHSCATILSEMGWNDTEVAEVLGVSEETARNTYIHHTGKRIINVQERIGGL